MTAILPDGPDTLINTTTAATLLGVSAATVVKWRKTSKVQVRGLDQFSRPLYIYRELAQVEQSTAYASGRRKRP